MLKRVLGVLLLGAVVVAVSGCNRGKEETTSMNRGITLPTKDRGPYPEEKITVPRYPGAVVENYEEVFAPGGKDVSFVRVYLNTKDPYEKVRDFYKKAFRDRYGEPTEEGEERGIYHVMKAKGKGYAPYFQIEVTDLGDYRRVVITRADENK